ncbi:hypothetical protein QBC42DRAFT_231067 [Cladorrhinum samala]|uniref:Uncharacterized protein n=1 Tax=Cladorrhinum samala TaxID=585594 RepID=A0AAV9HFT5_9PEZI|nr:hypothetical protein QBC42DRAFT_231067 [Cladorrhinum samala]
MTANERFADPIVTRATVRSSKPVLVEHDQIISSLRASRTADANTHEPTYDDVSPTKSRSQSYQTDLYTPSSPRLSLEMKNSLRQKRHSVADLRLAFERAAQLNFGYNKSSIPTTPKGRSTETNSGSPTKAIVSTLSYPQSCPKPAQQHLSYDSLATITPTQPRSICSSLSATRIPEPAGPKSTGRKTIHEIAKDEERTAIPGLKHVRPLLRARTLSVKVSTVSPKPTQSPTKSNIKERLSRSGVGRKVLPGPPPSPFLQHWRTRRETAPVKSGPSLPIMVSTTVAVTTQRGPSSLDSSTRSTPFRTRGESSHQSTASSAYSKGYQDGPVESPVKDAADSPVKDKISMFEHLNHKDSKPAIRKPRSHDQPGTSENARQNIHHPSVKRPSAWELKRGAKALRALSFTGHRETTVALGSFSKIPKQSDKTIKFPVRVRHSVAVPKPDTPDGISADDTQTALRSKAMGVAPRTDRYSLAPRPDSTFFVKGTLWKVPHADSVSLKHSQSSYSPKETQSNSTSVPNSPSSAELVNKTINTRPNLFYSTSTKTGRILPDRRSYGALEGKKSWDSSAAALTPARHVPVLADPFLDASAENMDLYLQSAQIEIPAIVFEPPTPAPGTVAASVKSSDDTFAPSLPILEAHQLPLAPHPPAAATDVPQKSWKRASFIPVSFGKKTGEAVVKKSAALGPILSPDLAHGTHGVGSDDAGSGASAAHRRASQSWGKRAAAAALGIGRRLRDRRASSSTAGSGVPGINEDEVGDDESGVGGGGGGGRSMSGLQDVVVATPNCRLQHPRPSRKVDWRKFEV